jgi:hypothetical protein
MPASKIAFLSKAHFPAGKVTLREGKGKVVCVVEFHVSNQAHRYHVQSRQATVNVIACLLKE